MADLDRVKIDCEEKLDLFDSLLRRHDPTRMDPVDVQENHKSWCEELSNVLNSLAKSVTREPQSSHEHGCYQRMEAASY